MNLYLKLILVCVLGVVLSVLIKKNSPEIALILSISIIISCLLVIAKTSSVLEAQFRNIEAFSYLDMNAFGPLIKCVAISVITQISCAICKDAGHSAVAFGLEFTGSIAVVLCMMPLIESMFQLVGGIL